MPLEEQQEEAAKRIYELGLFEFLCRPAIREGEVSHSVIPLSIGNLDRDEETGEYQFPNYERVARLRRTLESQAGIPAAAMLKELDLAYPPQRGELKPPLLRGTSGQPQHRLQGADQSPRQQSSGVKSGQGNTRHEEEREQQMTTPDPDVIGTNPPGPAQIPPPRRRRHRIA
jgi:hypothetical protein